MVTPPGNGLQVADRMDQRGRRPGCARSAAGTNRRLTAASAMTIRSHVA